LECCSMAVALKYRMAHKILVNCMSTLYSGLTVLLLWDIVVVVATTAV
jgi:hypothetical protein